MCVFSANGHINYSFHAARLNYSPAKKACEASGTTVAMIRNEADHQKIMSIPEVE